jgi:hypothetical protein
MFTILTVCHAVMATINQTRAPNIASRVPPGPSAIQAGQSVLLVRQDNIQQKLHQPHVGCVLDLPTQALALPHARILPFSPQTSLFLSRLYCHRPYQTYRQPYQQSDRRITRQIGLHCDQRLT